ncbi:MAG TPA: glycoside hydrolase family 18 protein [Terriglobia bacterium]|nr:glycoside hydrolase family 18 protein [Terriglobia bacterium]
MKPHRRAPASAAALVMIAMAVMAAPPSSRGQAIDGTQQLTKRVVGDYGYWSRAQDPPYSSAQIPFHKLTQINHAGVSFDSTGALSVPYGFLEPELIQNAHAAGDKVLLLLGGDFPALDNNNTVLTTLVQNLELFIDHNGYDGVDIDWEYPASESDRTAFFNLMTRLRAVLPSPQYLISADVAPWGGSAYGFSQVEPLLDQFNILMYDCAGPWTDDGQLNSPIFPDPHDPEPWECEPGGSVKEAADIYLGSIHLPADKLNMGTPFYGYYYTNSDGLWGPCKACNNTVLSENYGTYIKPRINQGGWETRYDPISLVPYMVRSNGNQGFITYDDPFSTFYRVWYSDWERNLGGTFLWSLDADYDGHTQDLLDAMYHASLKQTP